MKYSFKNDYSEGTSKEILEALIKHNFEQNDGYGLDSHSLRAAELIRNKCGHDDLDVHFIQGGTPCNVLAVSLLRPFEAVICADTGHINGHETAAVEHTGHKILTAKNQNGKILPQDIEKICFTHTNEHESKPRMVYISQATELGTTYSIKELETLRLVCNRHNLYLYIDGARLGSGLLAEKMSLKDIADVADIFYIGGTKNGGLFGEALCIRNDELKKDFRYLIKQNCSMLAKGFTVGIQFEKMFEENLYFSNAAIANTAADELRCIFAEKNIPLFVESGTNQVFVIMENSLISKIEKEYGIETWGAYSDTHTVVRFVTSWNIKEKNLQEFRDYLNIVKE